jgi:hypothetical protein
MLSSRIWLPFKHPGPKHGGGVGLLQIKLGDYHVRALYPRHLRVSIILSIASYSFDINVMSFYHSYIGRSFHNLARRHGPYENQAHFNDRY